MLRYLLLMVWFGVAAFGIKAQSLNGLKFRTYGLREGLPFNEVSDLACDAQGFLWVGTLDGVCRFDGYQFEYFKANPSIAGSLRHSGNYSFTTDSRHRFWIGNTGGLAYFDPSKQQFVYPSFGAVGDSLEVLGLWDDGDQTLWVVANNRLWHLNTTTLQLDTTAVQIRGCLCLYGDSRGNVWMSGIGGQLLCYRPAAKSFQTWQTPFESIDAHEDARGNIWFTGSGLFCWNTDTHTYQEYKPGNWSENEPFFPRHLSTFPALTGDSVLWMSTVKQGLVLFDMRRGEFFNHRIQSDPTAPFSLPANRTTYLLNKGNVLWVATAIGGLAKLDVQDQDFGSVRFPFMDELVAPGISAIHSDPVHRDVWWIALKGNNGLVAYNNLEKRVLHWYLKGGKSDENATKDLLFDRQQSCWVATRHHLYQLKNGKLQAREPTGQPLEMVRLAAGRNGRNWGIATTGVLSISPAGGVVMVPSPDYLRSNFTFPLLDAAEDSRGQLWVATIKGLAQVDVPTGVWNLLPVNIPGGDHMDGWINDLLVDEADNLWLATLGGLVYYNTRNGTSVLITEEAGVPPGSVYQIQTDPAGKLWAFTQRGVFYRQSPGSTFQKLLIPSGFSNDDIRGIWRSIHWLDNRFFYSQEAYNLFFDPLRVNQNRDLAFPVIRKFFVKNQLYPFDQQEVEAQPLSLANDQNFLLFDFTALNFTQSERMQFRYILEGFDPDTTLAGTRRTANYTNLPEGRYTFKVWAANSAGIWNPEPAVFHIQVLPPWWRTWWFQLLSAGLLFLAIREVFQRKARQLKRVASEREREAHFKQREAELRHEVSEVKLAALRAQMSPHFVFNCLNSINNYIVMNDPDNASHYLGMFSKLIRRVLDASRSEYVNLAEEIETLRLYIGLESMRFGNRFEYNIEVDPAVEVHKLVLPPMLIQPYVENAIWHGLMQKDDGVALLTLSVQQHGQEIVITVEDNGIGRKKAAALKSKAANQHKSHGMTVTHERLGMINDLYQLDARVRVQDLQNTAGEDCGTRVVLRLEGR
jgi:ligand-binding sensor domain-containing protein